MQGEFAYMANANSRMISPARDAQEDGSIAKGVIIP